MRISNIKLNNIRKEITITYQGEASELMPAIEEIKSGKQYELVLVRASRNKSMSQFRLAWAKIVDIANRERCDKNVIYEECLRRYGQSEILEVGNVDELKTAYKIVDVLKETENSCVVRAYPGMEKFNSRELAIFTDGVMDEWRCYNCISR